MTDTHEMAELKRDNRMTVFRLLLEQKAATRSDVCRLCGLSAPTVIKIFDFFNQHNLLSHAKRIRESAPGRSPTRYLINEDSSLTLSLIYEGDICRISYVTLSGKVAAVSSTICSDHLCDFWEQDLPAIIQGEMQHNAGKIKCIGIALPAIICADSIISAPYLGITAPFSMAPAAHRITAEYGLPLIVENDVNAAAVGEYQEHDNNMISNMAYIAINRGVGAGLILDKKLYRGSRGFAGEIGYFNTDIHAFRSYTQLGALESRLDEQTLQRRWPGMAQSQRDKNEAISYIADHLSLLMSNLQCTLDLDLFILGGQHAHAFGEELIDAINTRLSYLGESGVLCRAEKCVDSTAVGVALLSQKQWLNQLFLS